MNVAFQHTAVEPRESEASRPEVIGEERFRALGSLEPWISFAIGAAILHAANANQGGLIPWLPGICSLVVGVWAWSRRRAPMAERIARGVLLIGFAHAIRLAPGGDTATAMVVFLFGVTLASGYYALLLHPAGAACTSATSVACYFAASSFPGGGSFTPAPAGGFALLFVLLALVRLAAGMRQPGQTTLNAALNLAPAMYGRVGFISRGEQLLAAQRGARRELSLAVFDCCDLLEIRRIYGRATARTLMKYILDRLTLLSGERGFVACTGPAQFTVALPLGRGQAMGAIGRVLGKPVHFDPGCKYTELVVVPTFVVEAVSPGDCVSDRLTSMCRSLAAINQDEQLRLHYLQRARERHSRPPSSPAQSTPNPLAISGHRCPGRQADTQCMSATIPVPLSR